MSRKCLAFRVLPKNPSSVEHRNQTTIRSTVTSDWSLLTGVAYPESFMAGSVIERPMQVDFVTGAGDAQWTGIVPTEGD